MKRQEAALNYLKHIIEAFRCFGYELDSEDVRKHLIVASTLALEMPLMNGSFDPDNLKEEIKKYMTTTGSIQA